MAITHYVTITATSDDNKRSTLSGSAVSGNRETVFSKSVGASQTDLLVPMAFTTANLMSIFLLSDQNMTLETNSGGSPSNTFSLVANVPFVWQYQSGVTNPFSADVTAFYVTNTTALTFKGRILTT